MNLRTPSHPPIDFVMESSLRTLEEWEMARWNLVSKLTRERNAIQREIDRLTSEALEARYFREHRDELLEFGRTQALQETLAFIDTPRIEPNSLESEPKRRVANAD